MYFGKPLLEKLNTNTYYRPISSLPFAGKIIALTSHGYFVNFLSGFLANHSTETALIKVVNGPSTLLITMYFYTDWNIGFSGTVIKFLRTYLQYIAIGNYTSTPRSLTCGVPLGSILGP